MGDPSHRKLWLDWQRGLAVLFMVEWHTWDSWRADTVAVGPVHDVVNLIGGLAAPSFLYMAGLSQLLGDVALERKGIPVAERRRRAARRGLWLLAVAYLFRVAEYLLGAGHRVPGGWQAILKVDVLNVIAVSFLAAVPLAVGRGHRTHVALAASAAAVVALAAPLVAGWQHEPSRLLDYLYSEWPRGNFHLFPWAAFCFAGSALGRLALGSARPRTWILLGCALGLAGWLGDRLPAVYAHQDFWHTSPSWFAIRLGALAVTSGALQLLPATGTRWLAWLRTLGRHSLLGYFVSIEIPYGLLSRPLHRALGTRGALVGIVAMVAVTWAAAEAAERFQAWKGVPEGKVAPPVAPA